MSKVLTRGSLFLLLSVFAACASEEAAEDAASQDVEDTASESTLERFAGNWAIRAFDTAGDTIPGHVLIATADSTAWTINFTDRPPIRAHILDASGDLVVYETERYESVIRPGVQVTVVFVSRINGESMTGRFIAHYDVGGAAAVLRGRTEGSRQ